MQRKRNVLVEITEIICKTESKNVLTILQQEKILFSISFVF